MARKAQDARRQLLPCFAKEKAKKLQKEKRRKQKEIEKEKEARRRELKTEWKRRYRQKMKKFKKDLEALHLATIPGELAALKKLHKIRRCGGE